LYIPAPEAARSDAMSRRRWKTRAVAKFDCKGLDQAAGAAGVPAALATLLATPADRRLAGIS